MKKDDNLLTHMLEDISDIIDYTKDVHFDTFVINTMLRKAVCMSLINIGELAKALSSEFRASHKEIPWKNISGLRDITVHTYHNLNLDIIWSVVQNDVPVLEKFIRKTINN